MMFDRRLITHFNWSLLLVTLGLLATGLVNLYSATSSFEPLSQTAYFKAQALWAVLGFAGALVIALIHYRHFFAMGYVIYGISIALLLSVFALGREVAGHQSWIAVGSMSLQPTEVAKLGFIIGMSKHLSRLSTRQNLSARQLLPSLGLFLLPTALVILQGDLGSSLFFALIYASLILLYGVQWRVIASVAVAAVAVALVSFFFFLSPYQKDRINTFLNPENDRQGTGYHLIQSKIAVGSGGWLGKGYLRGQTHKLKFIPERHTDFIFPVLAEEWGFLGSFAVLLLFTLFLFFSLQITYRSTDRFGFFLCSGITALFFWHLVINLGGVLGLMPLTGVPLPFFSYGGSALLTGWLGIGFLLNISMRRFRLAGSQLGR